MPHSASASMNYRNMTLAAMRRQGIVYRPTVRAMVHLRTIEVRERMSLMMKLNQMRIREVEVERRAALGERARLAN